MSLHYGMSSPFYRNAKVGHERFDKFYVSLSILCKWQWKILTRNDAKIVCNQKRQSCLNFSKGNLNTNWWNRGKSCKHRVLKAPVAVRKHDIVPGVHLKWTYRKRLHQSVIYLDVRLLLCKRMVLNCTEEDLTMKKMWFPAKASAWRWEVPDWISQKVLTALDMWPDMSISLAIAANKSSLI